MITTQFLNTHQQPITEQQAQTAPSYYLQTIVDGKLKQTQFFFDSNIFHVEYFLNPAENLQNFIAGTVIQSTHSWTIYSNLQILGTFNQWDMARYSNVGELKVKGINVFDSQNRIILFVTFNLLTNEVIEWPSKYYYGSQTGDNALLQINYDTDGSLYSLYDINDNFNCAWKAYGPEQFLTTTMAASFNIDEHPYYQELTPYLPTGDL